MADVAEQAVDDMGSDEIPAGLSGLSSIDARRLLKEIGPNRWVKQDRFARVREAALIVERIPRTLVFWTVWTASALSLLVILYIPAAAHMFRVEPPPGGHVVVAILLGVLAVGWRLHVGRHSCGARAVPNGSREPDPRAIVTIATHAKAAVPRTGSC
ncbi:MAG: hypothetical protein AB7K63_03690 [Vicinamibacterales bacterium]